MPTPGYSGAYGADRRLSRSWCTFLVPRHRFPDQPLAESLGCVRFSAELVRSEPYLMDRAARWSEGGLEPGHWRHLDTAVAVVLHDLGLLAHVHGPPVVHLPSL
jgi:hypothetical protein